MIQTGFEKRVQVQQILANQLPDYVRAESPKTLDFLKQYYISQEYQGGPADIAENLDQYLKLDNLTPEVITGTTTLYSGITSTTDSVQVYTTKGFPDQYGLFKIDDEIFTYTGITTNTFTGVVRGFSGISSYRTDLNSEELVFEDTNKASHDSGTTVKNLSSEFLKEFYRKLKYTYTPGLEDVDFVSDLDVNNFIKEARSFYEGKGTEESFRILFNVLYGESPKVIDLEDYLTKPSTSEFLRREIVVAERISGDPDRLVGQTIKKESDSATQASVSEVEIFTRSGISTYFKLGLFVGFDDRDLIEGTFEIQPKTRSINPVSVGSSVITVDTTIGFGATGTLISGNNVITYSSKSVNQFLGCLGVDNAIATKDNIRTNDVFVGYEDGDLDKKVEIRISGVLSDVETIGDVKLSTENQKIFVKNVGEKIKNPSTGKSFKQLFANSWIYNTSTRFDVDSITGSNFTLKTTPIDSTLKVGDTVDVLVETTETLAATNAIVATISGKQVTLNNLGGFSPVINVNYAIRRKLRTATSSSVPIVYGNSNVTSDIQNVYVEGTKNFYVASNSLPSYDVTSTISQATLTSVTGTNLQSFSNTTQKYSILSFGSNVPFLTGDEVVYKSENTPIVGLSDGSYFVKVLTLPNQIKLYKSRSLIDSDSCEEFTAPTTAGYHKFTLAIQKSESIYPQKILGKFPAKVNIQNGNASETAPGSTGMLVNGVEILNYKSEDKVYYGPLSGIRIYSKGSNYDVVSPPSLTVGDPVGSATTALVQPVTSGYLREVIVDPQSFDVAKVSSVTITGGNSTGAVLQAVLEDRNREIEFDSRQSVFGGGVNVTDDDITFTLNHNLKSGQEIVYNRNGNTAIGIGNYRASSNLVTGNTLNSGSVYVTEVVNNKTIRIYETLDDYNSGINTVGFTTAATSGIHKFRTYKAQSTIKEIKVINTGSKYENRKLIVKPEGVYTVNDTINFKKHGFSDGDLISYTTDGTVIGGLSVSNQYKILKIDDNSFRLANAGVGGTITSNYERKNYINLTSTGTGTQNFAYPDISITVNAEIIGGTGIITATPVIRGTLDEVYLYEAGTGYGSTVLNFHKKPDITSKIGKNAELKPLISGGKIISVQVTNGGKEFTSAPDLTVVSPSGIGAKLRAVITNEKISDVVVANSGIGYTANTTSIKVTPNGKNASMEASVRTLTLNNYYRFGNEILIDTNEGLQYGFVGYSTAAGLSEFGDNSIDHSPIIGWAYDGNPIYGPYAYSDKNDINSQISHVTPSYVLSTTDITDRPGGFADGFFVEDYKYNNSGDLDQYNGRYGKTPDFPNGTYAYFAGINTNTSTSLFPHFIGNQYRSLPITQNVDQSFNFNASDLVRNTLPYNVSEPGADNDFINEPNEAVLQSSTIESVTKGPVKSLAINEPGEGYRVGDVASFDNTGTNGGGLSAFVDKVTGKTVEYVTTTLEDYQNTSVVWDKSGQLSVHIDPTHTLMDNDNVVISGVSTYVKGLTKQHKIGVSSEKVYLISDLPANTAAGIVTDIFVSTVPTVISAGSTIGLGTERLAVLNVFPDRKVIRALREEASGIHTASSELCEITGAFTIPVDTPYFESKLDDKVYFNPVHSLGIGVTSGFSESNTYIIGNIPVQTSIPTQSIYLPGHPFKQNQEVTLTKGGAQRFSVSNTGSSSMFNLPISGESQNVYVINKSKDYIGLTTQIGLTTSTDGLFFRDFDSNNDDTDFRYSLESNYSQVTAKVEKIKATVAVSTAHGLVKGDVIDLTISPKQSIGIGNSESVVVKYNSANDKLLVNPVGFGSTAINTTSNEVELTSHGYQTGDKIFYDSSDLIVSGLETGSYYVYRIDDNKFNLSETLKDTELSPPTVVSFGSTGGASQEFSEINPSIPIIRNNNLVFNVGDSSLSGYNFKLFYDNKFNNELVSIGSTLGFNVVSSGSTVTLNYNKDLPTKLYYSIEKSGFISTADTDVRNYSELFFVNSEYNNSYTVSGIGVTTFDISVRKEPEVLYYNKIDTDITYKTSSANAVGGVGSLKMTFGGANYKKLPKFVSIGSTDGINADVIPDSDVVGKIKQINIDDPGFDFSADKTLNPEAFVSPIVTVIDRNEVSEVEILSGGKGYSSAPDLVLINPETGNKYDTGVLKAELQGSAISSIELLETPIGLSDITNKIFAVNGDNGVGVNSCFSNTSGIVTCFLSTPIIGFSTDPFAVGDEVYVEGIKNVGGTGEGFNSQDHKYNFFPVIAYSNTNPAKLVFDASQYVDTNAGIAVTSQNSFASVIKRTDYPSFRVVQQGKTFIIGEKVYIKSGNSYTEVDLVVTENLNDSIKVYGTYELSSGQEIFGKNSGTLATIKSLDENLARFKINYSSRIDRGWSDDIGKLNLDYQVIPDNDYYQNLSYTVKSSQTYEDLSSTVNSLLHPTGLKNFADTGITTTGKVSIGSSNESTSTATLDIISDSRVDTQNFYDLGVDIDVQSSRSKFIKFRNKKLSDYIKCITNRVLSIDDFSSEFSNAGGDISDLFVDTHDYSILDGYTRFLVQVIDPSGNDRQVTELITLPTPSGDIVTVEKGSIYNRSDHVVADLQGDLTDGTLSLRFTPYEKYENDYDIKVIKNKFNTTSAGIGTQSVGFVDLVASNAVVSAADTATLYKVNTSTNEGFFVNAEMHNATTSERTYAELYVDHSGSDTFTSEFYFDNDTGSISDRFIGTFTSSISSGVLSLDYTNTEANDVTVRTKIIGFGAISTGIGTYRFKASGQPDTSEQSGRIQSNYKVASGVSTVFSVLKADVTAIKSTAKVGYGNSSALHQFLIINDPSHHPVVTQYPFLPVGTGNTTGIGTFGPEISGSNLLVKFYPDAGVGIVTVHTSSEIIQTSTDKVNIPNTLVYGSVSEDLFYSEYNGRNGNRVNRTDFHVNHNGVPIFKKTFDPSSALVLATGIFTITDHFFQTGEALTYVSASTFAGASASDIQVSGAGDLPDTVYAIRVNNDQFKLATSKANALAGTNLTYSSAGAGNAHTLEMHKKLSKSIVSVDGVVQNPITYTKLAYTLDGPVSAAVTYFGLSGIGSVVSGDILKVDDEYMKVAGVGLGTTAAGPIIGSGAINVVNVERGFVGSTAATHNNAATARVYLGAFNMVDSKIHFTEPPYGNTAAELNDGNIPIPRSTFGGRVYLRQDYATNQVYDSVSKDFTGIGATYTLTVGGANTTGIETGSGVMFLNDIFQTPTTVNNSGNNYSFIEGATGISSVVYTGITDTNGDIILSDYDVNVNQLPRGGVIVSLGSTNGIGYAPLVGASVTAVTGAGGTITAVGVGTADIVGSGYRGIVSIGVTDVAYTHRFSSATTNGVTINAGGIGANSTLTPTDAEYTSYNGDMKIIKADHGAITYDTYTATTGTQYDGVVGILTVTLSATPSPALANGQVVRIDDAGVTFTCLKGSGNHNYVSGSVANAVSDGTNQYTVTDATYTPLNGNLVLDIGVHTLTTSDTVTIAVDSLGFTCDEDNYATTHYYPRTTDPAYNSALAISAVDQSGGTITVDVGKAAGSGHPYPRATDPYSGKWLPISNVSGGNKFEVGVGTAGPYGNFVHTFVSGVTNAIRRSANTIALANNSVSFKCSFDNYVSAKSYPRSTDPSSGLNLAIREATDDSITVGVGSFGGGGRGATVTAQVVENDHLFVSATGSGVTRSIGGTLTVDDASYVPATGVLTLTFTGAHGLTASSTTVTIANNSLTFTCAQDNHATNHTYPRTTDPASGTALTVLTTPSTTSITVQVGKAPRGTGGALKFTVTNPGVGYENPQIIVAPPSYENLPITGVSRLGQGSTTETGSNLLLTVDPTPTVGIGSTMFEVSEFRISRPGYGFRKGDVFTPVGLVTSRFLNTSEVVTPFELTVLETFTDSFSAWQFGELDYIDSLANFQNGNRTRFPLYYNDELVSFELDQNDTDSVEIDLNAVLLIFVNGVIQEPGQHYQFEGGTSFTFVSPPQEDDKIDVFFYRGTRGTDSVSVNTVETVKQGDLLRIYKNNTIDDTIDQTTRTIYNISTSDKVETNLYAGLGITETAYKPVSWTRQKVDRNIAGEAVYKTRDSIEPLVYPTARIIGDIATSGGELFVDDSQFFNYESSSPIDIDGLIVNTSGDPVAAAITAVVSAAGTVSSLNVVSGGSGYTGSTVTVKLSAPQALGVGVGTTATATLSVVNGALSGTANITNSGLGYTWTVPPQVLAPITAASFENVTGGNIIQGFTGIITGIQTSQGTGGNALAIEFFLSSSTFTGLSAGYPVYVHKTVSGSGVTSIDGHDKSIVGIGTTFLDNVYKVHAISNVGTNGIATCNILSTTSLTGIATTGSSTNPCGELSFGRLAGFTRNSSPISIGVTGLVVDSGLSTFPTIQRRGTGLRDSGGLSKLL